MKRKSLVVESLEQRTVLSASAVVALDSLMVTDVSSNEAIPVTNHDSVETIEVADGDFNLDGLTDAADINMMCSEMHSNETDLIFDLNADSAVNKADMDILIRDFIGTEYGDQNLDGHVDTVDAGFMFQNIFTESTGWESGDFTCDGFVDGQDFIMWNNHKFATTKLNSVEEPVEFKADELDESEVESAAPTETNQPTETNPPMGTNHPTEVRQIHAAESPVIHESATDDELEKTAVVANPTIAAPVVATRALSSNVETNTVQPVVAEEATPVSSSILRTRVFATPTSTAGEQLSTTSQGASTSELASHLSDGDDASVKSTMAQTALKLSFARLRFR